MRVKLFICLLCQQLKVRYKGPMQYLSSQNSESFKSEGIVVAVIWIFVAIFPTVSSDSEKDSSSESLLLGSPKRQCSRPSCTQQRYNRKWEKDFQWLEYNEN